MGFSVAAATLLLSGSGAFAQSPDNPPTEYKMLRGQTLQLKKPANDINAVPVLEPAPIPTPTLVEPAPVQQLAPLAAPTIVVPSNTNPVFQPVSRVKELEPQDPKPKDDKKVDPVPPPKKDELKTDEANQTAYKVKTGLPSTEELFILESEKRLESRIKTEYMIKPGDTANYNFPDQPKLASGMFPGRSYPKSQILSEANYVYYGKLYFSEKNAERYGWDLGFIQPFVSSGYFLKDFFFFPYHVFSHPFCGEISPTCLPGDQVPYKWYHDDLTYGGILGEAGIVVALAFMIP